MTDFVTQGPSRPSTHCWLRLWAPRLACSRHEAVPGIAVVDEQELVSGEPFSRDRAARPVPIRHRVDYQTPLPATSRCLSMFEVVPGICRAALSRRIDENSVSA